MCRTACTLCGPLLRAQMTGLETQACSMVRAVPASSSGCAPDAARTAQSVHSEALSSRDNPVLYRWAQHKRDALGGGGVAATAGVILSSPLEASSSAFRPDTSACERSSFKRVEILPITRREGCCSGAREAQQVEGEYSGERRREHRTGISTLSFEYASRMLPIDCKVFEWMIPVSARIRARS